MNLFFACLAIILMLAMVVGFHELGHYMAARFFGVKVGQLSIGFGKALVHWPAPSGVLWVWRLLPLGGYVELLTSRTRNLKKHEACQCIDKKTPWAQIIIFCSGIIANFIMALLAFSLVYSLGVNVHSPQVVSVKSPSIAASTGLQAGDTLLRVNGEESPSWQTFAMAVISHVGSEQSLQLTVANSKGQQRHLKMDLSTWHYTQKDKQFLGSLGITPLHDARVSIKRYDVGTSILKAFQKVAYYLCFFILLIKQIIVGNVPLMALMGPLGLFALTADMFSHGVVPFINFIGLLSVAVALINSLPIPGLDGASVVYVMLEKIRKKPLSLSMELLLQRLTLIAFWVFMVQLLMNDLRRFFIE